jgi:prepilin-type N-terminal cleavage/methylation domain-containing protein/prepilin-type processing-associated H-X9-DG protein
MQPNRGVRAIAGRSERGFTLIEILVVVAIIALLISILLPSLSRARAQARFVTCQSNIRQVMMGFLVYATENKNRLPGHGKDAGADWLGGSNQGGPALQPKNGTIFRQMGKTAAAYTCPDDVAKRAYPVNGQKACDYSYTSNALLSGAAVEQLGGAHYPRVKPFDRNDHRVNMAPFDGVPVLIEEDPNWYLAYVDDSAWCNEDTISDRHLRFGSDPGAANIAYHDGHAGRVRFRAPPYASTYNPADYFNAESMCIRTVGGKWVSGRSWVPKSGGAAGYGYLNNAEPASVWGIQH